MKITLGSNSAEPLRYSAVLLALQNTWKWMQHLHDECHMHSLQQNGFNLLNQTIQESENVPPLIVLIQ